MELILKNGAGISADEKIYVGSKPILAYVTAIATSFQRADNVSILARGRAISNAVDAVEVPRRSFITDLNVNGIQIGTEQLGEKGAERSVSTITIKISRSTP